MLWTIVCPKKLNRCRAYKHLSRGVRPTNSWLSSCPINGQTPSSRGSTPPPSFITSAPQTISRSDGPLWSKLRPDLNARGGLFRGVRPQAAWMRGSLQGGREGSPRLPGRKGDSEPPGVRDSREAGTGAASAQDEARGEAAPGAFTGRGDVSPQAAFYILFT